MALVRIKNVGLLPVYINRVFFVTVTYAIVLE